MQRLVTLLDLEQHPELVSKGVSLNQYFDFDLYESDKETPVVVEEPIEQIQEQPRIAEEKKATNPTKKKIPAKQKAKSK